MSMINFVLCLTQISCAGAVVAAAFSIDKILDINNCCTIDIGIIRTTISAPDIIDQVNSNIRQRSEATAAMAVVAGLVIPLG
ncbi:MAG: hypothetical protein MJE68_25660, partial [Proteobacteria bacterium]|nr:hypothetical protein [Pseudomonadota bacterium]